MPCENRVLSIREVLRVRMIAVIRPCSVVGHAGRFRPSNFHAGTVVIQEGSARICQRHVSFVGRAKREAVCITPLTEGIDHVEVQSHVIACLVSVEQIYFIGLTELSHCADACIYTECGELLRLCFGK